MLTAQSHELLLALRTSRMSSLKGLKRLSRATNTMQTSTSAFTVELHICVVSELLNVWAKVKLDFLV